MRFTGIGRTFSTLDDRQYETIGAFWDELSAEYGRVNLRGLGYGWTADSIKYVIGLKDDDISGYDTELILPDDGWITVCGKTEDLGQIYRDIYKDGALKYEIEMFNDDGNCRIMYRR